MVKRSIGKQILNDSATTNSLLYPILIWAVNAFGAFSGWVPARSHGMIYSIDISGDSRILFLSVSIAVTSIFLAVLLARLLILGRLCSRGESVPGKIVELDNIDGSGSGDIRYRFVFDGIEYEDKVSVLINSRYTGALSKNMEISVLVNPKRPKLSFIRELIESRTGAGGN